MSTSEDPTQGREVGETPREDADIEEIGLLMAGGQDPRAD